MTMLQLKPKEQSFVQIAREIKRLRAIILCEGDQDIETLKALIGKASVQIVGIIGLTDCEGAPQLDEMSAYVASLVRNSRRLEKIVLITDADTHQASQRVNSLRDSLRANGVHIRNPRIISGSIYSSHFEGTRFLIKVAGKMELPFRSHEMEDYAVHLLISRGEIQEGRLKGFHKASDLIIHLGKKVETIIQESQGEEVEASYENVLNLLRII